MKEFVELREAWFDRVLRLDENAIEGRCYHPKVANKEMKACYDQQTVAIVLGKKRYNVAPRCANDLGEGF